MKTPDVTRFLKAQAGGRYDRSYNSIIRPEYTPDKISSLKPGEIFVFGSNLKGQHGGGAARIARMYFGAIMGKGVGLQGQSYAIPTMQGGVETIRPYVDEFICFAKEHSELFFYVTRIGCGIAGFKDEEMAPLFAKAIDMKNVCLPKSFADVIKNSRERRKNIFTHVHGITRTLADIVIERNKRKKFNSPDEVMEDLNAYFDRFAQNGDTVALSAIRIFHRLIVENGVFTSSGLDVECFKSKMADYQEMANQYDKAYFQYCLEVIYNLVVFLNEFRRYTNPFAVSTDINELRLCDTSCGSTVGYSEFLLTGQDVANAPLYYFEKFLDENWCNIASNGILDAELLNELMFNKHERGLRRYGLQAVLDHDYIQNGCHPNVYLPIRIGTGPRYVKQDSGKYIRSCGNGICHFSEPFPLERNAAYNILLHDTRYESLGGYIVPESDMTLPVLDPCRGIVSFKSDEAKRKFIEDLKKED
jgi:hypothetical protein